MIGKLTKLSIARYFFISCMAGIIDFCTAYLLYKIVGINYLMACNLGIIAGFIFQYYTSMRYIFKNDNFLNSFIVYIITFLIGFVLADGTMLVSYSRLKFDFIISKGLSMLIPFFITYLARKSLLGLKADRGD